MNSLIHFGRFLIGLDGPRSQLTSAELAMVIKHARGARAAVEIGCAEGKTSVALASVVEGPVYSVDTFTGGRLGISYAQRISSLHRRRQRVNNLHFIKGTSIEVAHRFSDPIDFLFIDGDHSYDGARADWDLWGAKVRPAGIIACHDCRVASSSRNELGSMRVYEDHMRRASWVAEIDGVDSLAVFRVLSTPDAGPAANSMGTYARRS